MDRSGQGDARGLRARLAARELLVGSFVKTPHPHVVEVLARGPLDLLVLDCEHAPFDRTTLDLCLLAARGGAAAAMVRPWSAAAHDILPALDCGAQAILAPHVRDGEAAQALVRACRYGPGGRGYAGATRFAAGRPMAEVLDAGEAVTVVAQIEDADAVAQAGAIAATPGLDALFIGRADLTVSLGLADQDAPRVVEAVRHVLAAGLEAGVAVGLFVARPGDVASWREAGASLFLLESDQQFLAAGASALAATVKGG